MAASVSPYRRPGATKDRYRARMTTPDGQHRSRVFDTRREAKDWLVDQQASVRTGTYVDPQRGQQTLGSFVNSTTVSGIKLKPSSADTARHYRNAHILPRWGNVPLGKITVEGLQDWIATLLSQTTLAPATVHKIGVQTSMILRRAAQVGAIVANPMKDVELPRPATTEMRFISADEIRRVADSIDSRYSALVLCAGFGGFRFGELAGLRPSLVDTSGQTVRIIVQENAVQVGGHVEFGTPKSAAAKRAVPLPPSVGAALKLHMRMYAGRFVFPAPDGGVLHANNFRRRFWAPALDHLAGLEDEDNPLDLVGLRMHDLRHSAISLWIAAGFNVKRVATWAGHASSAFTLDRYGHLFRDDDDDAAIRLDQVGKGRLSA